MPDKPLLAVPNVSEGRRQATIEAIGQAFTAAETARLLDIHSDTDHNRSVFTLAGRQGKLSDALLAGARVAIERVAVEENRDAVEIGVHPHVGAIDVVPLVYLDVAQRGAACAEALVVAAEIGDSLRVPVFLYGELARGRTRAELRRGGVAGLAKRLSNGELRPDFGPSRMHPTAGATLVAAREPLVAFNLELAPPATVQDAKRIAGLIRDGGPEGLPGLRALGVSLIRGSAQSKSPMLPARAGSTPFANVLAQASADTIAEQSADTVAEPSTNAAAKLSANPVAQLSMNVERPLELPLRAIVEAVRRYAEIACGELVGLAPRAAFEGFPDDVALSGFDAEAHLIENALGF
jgi:glutamate formiminotransferase/glutamate formiminotransferase/formiminotetrahydrofolate cyclodeaminase